MSEHEPRQDQKPMIDEKYLLLRQSFFDAKKILIETCPPRYHTDKRSLVTRTVSGPTTQEICDTAHLLYNDRVRDPLTLETLKRLTLSGYNAVSVFEEIKDLQESYNTLGTEYDEKLVEYNKINEKIVQLKTDIDKLDLLIRQDKYTRAMKQRDQKAYNFMVNAIGHEHIERFNTKGFLDILGTNRGIYRLERDGKITKFVNKSGEWVAQWNGRISGQGDLPLDDCVATIYAHIMKDSDKFDEDKACGNIYIR